MNSKNFVKTRDEATARTLKNEVKLQLVNFANGVWTFLNCQKMDFAEDQDEINKKVVYTDNLIV